MQQQAVNEFAFNVAEEGAACVWQPMPKALSDRVEAVIARMLDPAYAGKVEVLIPVPMVARQTPVEIPDASFVAIGRSAFSPRIVRLHQFSVRILSDGVKAYEKRPIRVPDYIPARYPHSAFYYNPLPSTNLDYLFWHRFSRLSRALCDRISLSSPHVMPVMSRNGFNHVQTVLQAGLMQPGPVFASLVIPDGDRGGHFMVFTRVDHRVVNTASVLVSHLRPSAVIQSPLGITLLLEQGFPGWSFPYVKLTAHELFNLIQLPVRAHYMRVVQRKFMLAEDPEDVGACLLALAMALHPRLGGEVEGGGFCLGSISEGIMVVIVDFVMEAWNVYP